MEAVRLTDGEEYNTLAKSEIVALIEALCERPLEDGQADPPAELQAFCREAAKAFIAGRRWVYPPRPGHCLRKSTSMTAALATHCCSGSDAGAARRTVRRSDAPFSHGPPGCGIGARLRRRHRAIVADRAPSSGRGNTCRRRTPRGLVLAPRRRCGDFGTLAADRWQLLVGGALAGVGGGLRGGAGCGRDVLVNLLARRPVHRSAVRQCRSRRRRASRGLLPMLLPRRSR